MNESAPKLLKPMFVKLIGVVAKICIEIYSSTCEKYYTKNPSNLRKQMAKSVPTTSKLALHYFMDTNNFSCANFFNFHKKNSLA
mgnify:CR=1 FL=1